jgi:S-DNA-T family DNA segregation ATPase FtsK/SpoIIIE
MRNSKYLAYGPDQLEEHFSQFLIDSWSYSKVSSFARNEKAFEMQYIFGIYGKKSSTTVAGSAYHTALEYYFKSLKDGVSLDLVELEASAFQYIDGVPANQWKIQKTTPTVEECAKKAYTTVSALLRNFVGEVNTYMDDIQDILDVEIGGKVFLTINGVDVPLPCSYKIDLVVRTKAGKIAIIDHKSKTTYTDEEEATLSIGEQAITYVNCYEEETGMHVDEVWFVENKYSKNKDNSQQIVPIKIILDDNTRKLYEALLYEPLQRTIKAVMDPDYVYLINKSDNMTDMAELYDFWCRTQICEVDDFNVEEAKKGLVSKRLKKIRDASVQMVSPTVIKKFKENASSFITYDLSTKDMTQEQKIEHCLKQFGMSVRVAYKFDGYSSNTYLVETGANVKVGSIHSRRLDIANALDVPNVRISNALVMHEGRSYLAVDFSKKRERDLIYDAAELDGVKIPIGKDNYGNTVIWDLNNQSTPHMLVCGATGSGKSVFLESTIEYAMEAGVDNVIIFDPKEDFRAFAGRKNVVVVHDILEIEEHMMKLVDYMNECVKSGKKSKTLVIFDEAADAIANSRKGVELDIKEMVQVGNYADKNIGMGMIIPGAPKLALKKTGELKSLEDNLRILLQKGRSSGFRIIIAMQRASTKILSGDAKANLPVQVCFRVPKEVDSRVVLDEAGAESLAGKGDGLIKSPEYTETVRFQAFYKPQNVMA